MLGTEKSVLDKSASEVEMVGWIQISPLWLPLLCFSVEYRCGFETPNLLPCGNRRAILHDDTPGPRTMAYSALGGA